MTLNEIPSTIIVFVIGQTATAAWAIITTHFKVRAIEQKMLEFEKENQELKKKLSEMSDTLLLVKHSVDLLVIGKLKTNTQK